MIDILRNTRFNITAIVFTTVATSVVSGVIVLINPTLATLIGLGVYEVLCQVISTPLEPAMLYTAKLYPIWQVTLVTTIGCNIGGIYDYWIFGPLLHHEQVRPRYENTRLFTSALKWFEKAPLITLIFIGFTPIPFVPLKLLAIAGGYPQWRYQLALLIGRAPRYAIISWLGYVIPFPNWLLVTIMILLVIAYVISHIRAKITGQDGSNSA
jgi:membrane protein YqaA with SNARE-associated domain